MSKVEYTDEFFAWFDSLAEAERDSVAALDASDDMPIGTLQRLVRAVGGEPDQIIHFPDREIALVCRSRLMLEGGFWTASWTEVRAPLKAGKLSPTECSWPEIADILI